MELLPYLKKVSLTWESLNYPVSRAVGVKSLLLNPVENISGVNSAEGVFEIKVVLPCVPAHNSLLKGVVLESNSSKFDVQGIKQGFQTLILNPGTLKEEVRRSYIKKLILYNV